MNALLLKIGEFMAEKEHSIPSASYWDAGILLQTFDPFGVTLYFQEY